MMMWRPSAFFLVGLALTFNNALGHGISEPQHGGIVKAAGDMSIELVNGTDQINIYLMDDDRAAITQAMSGKLKIEIGAEKFEVELEPSGSNSFVAKTAGLPKGAKAFAIITLPNGYSKIAAKFEID